MSGIKREVGSPISAPDCGSQYFANPAREIIHLTVTRGFHVENDPKKYSESGRIPRNWDTHIPLKYAFSWMSVRVGAETVIEPSMAQPWSYFIILTDDCNLTMSGCGKVLNIVLTKRGKWFHMQVTQSQLGCCGSGNIYLSHLERKKKLCDSNRSLN